MTNEMSATWRKMVGISLLWVALSALIYSPSANSNTKAMLVSVIGFFSFAAGAALFSDGMKREFRMEKKRK